MAPNLVTLTGLTIIIIITGLTLWFDVSLAQPIPAWVIWSIALANFAY